MPRRIELTTDQAAAIARVTPGLIRQWVARGHIKRTPRGRIDGASLIDYLDSRGTAGQHRHPRIPLPPALARALRDHTRRRRHTGGPA